MLKLTLFVVVVAVLVWYSNYFGSVSPPQFVEKDLFTLAYVSKKGSFVQIPEGFTEVHNFMSAFKKYEEGDLVGLGVYFDDPAVVKAEDVRFWIGFIIPEEDADELVPKLNGKFKDQGLRCLSFPKTANVASTLFPYDHMLSPMIGPSKAYPVLDKFLEEQKVDREEYPAAVEFYYLHGNKTQIEYTFYPLPLEFGRNSVKARK
eukprot:TRINITY_DN2802_c0_g2_i1.p1 TRINITY_DN2802_c0_g2~~TRINITY_DN2802_c0_g2_i1.p1  ORF type:complete len:204 (-),score=43.72 TRINITY_DN2802_c0_g2_i1:621-1232(-)